MHEFCRRNEDRLHDALGVSPAVRGEDIRWSQPFQYTVINVINDVTEMLCMFEQKRNHDDT